MKLSLNYHKIGAFSLFCFLLTLSKNKDFPLNAIKSRSQSILRTPDLDFHHKFTQNVQNYQNQESPQNHVFLGLRCYLSVSFRTGLIDSTTMGGLLAAIKRMEKWLGIEVTKKDQPYPFIPDNFV